MPTKKFRIELSLEPSSIYVGDKYWPNGLGLIQPDDSEDTQEVAFATLEF